MPNFLRKAILALAAILVAGCNPDPDPSGSVDYEKELVAVNAEYGSVTQEAAAVTPHLPGERIVTAKAKASGLLARLQRIPTLNEKERQRLEALHLQVKRLEAAQTVQQIKQKWEELFKDATLTPAERKKTVSEQRAILRGEWDEFRSVDDQLMAADRAYEDATNKLVAQLRREESIQAGPPE